MPSTVFIVTRVRGLIYEYSWLLSDCIIGKTAKTMLRYSAHGVRGAGAGDQSGVRMHEVFFEPKFGIFYDKVIHALRV